MERVPGVEEQKSADQVNQAGLADESTTVPWLKLGLDAPKSEEVKPQEVKPVGTPHRTFSCNYCMRSFSVRRLSVGTRMRTRGEVCSKKDIQTSDDDGPSSIRFLSPSFESELALHDSEGSW